MEDEKVDRLFLRTNCFDCGKVRAVVDFGAVIDDNFRGNFGQELRVYTALSTAAAKELLQKFGVDGCSVPLLLTFDGAAVEKPKNIITHLRRSGMIAE